MTSGKRSLAGLATAVVLVISLFAPLSAGEGEGPWWFPTQGEWVEMQMVEPDENPDDFDGKLRFGTELAIDGDTLVVGNSGSPNKRICSPDPYGCDRVYVFERGEGGIWNQIQRLTYHEPRFGTTFGHSMDVDDESGVMVIGNPGGVTKTNEIHIFERSDEGLWEEAVTFNRTYPDEYDDMRTHFGISVAVDGTMVAAADEGKMTTSVYKRDNGTWEMMAELRGGGIGGIELANETLLTLEGERKPVCGPGGWMFTNQLVHELIDGEWTLTAEIQPEIEYEGKSSIAARRALSEDGQTIVFGLDMDRRIYGVHTEYCFEEDVPQPIGPVQIHTNNGLAGAVGSALIFELVDGEWVQTADIHNPMPNPGLGTGGDTFGWHIDISGHMVVISADGDAYNGGPGSGAAYIYEKINGDWSMQAKLRNHDNDEKDFFGSSVGISGTTVAVGAVWNTHLGTVHLFEPNLGSLSEVELSSEF